MSSAYAAAVLSRTMRVVLLSSSSATSLRERRKSLNDRNPRDFSENDGSIRFIWALTAELCNQSASCFSYGMPFMTAKMVASAVLLCGVRRDPAKAPEKFAKFLAKGIEIANAPFAPETHWGQLLQPLREERALAAGGRARFRARVRRGALEVHLL